jgi:hypothetical protein
MKILTPVLSGAVLVPILIDKVGELSGLDLSGLGTQPASALDVGGGKASPKGKAKKGGAKKKGKQDKKDKRGSSGRPSTARTARARRARATESLRVASRARGAPSLRRGRGRRTSRPTPRACSKWSRRPRSRPTR